jgi:hypothetical protein
MTPAHGHPPTDAEHRQTRRWLDRVGGDELPVTPLLAARIAVRRRTERFMMAGFLAVLAALMGLLWWPGITTGDWETWSVLGLTASAVAAVCAYLVMAAVYLATVSYERAADRNLADTMARPAARSVRMSLRTLLGTQCVVSAVVMHASGAIIAVAVLILATHPGARTTGVVLLVGVLVFASVTAAVLSDITRRPIVVDDEMSMRADGLLRFNAARRAVASYFLVYIVAALTADRPMDILVEMALPAAIVVAMIASFSFSRPPVWISRGDRPMPVVVTR